MQTRERQLIQELFDRLRSAENQRRDPEVERLIADELRRAPHATYAMAQTIIAQNQALEAAGRRIEELENGRVGEEDDEEEGSFRNPFGGAMGAPDLGPGLGRRGSVPSFGRGAPQQGGGGFLANAGQVALGVAGGMLLGEAAKSLFGGSEAQAATSSGSAGDTAAAGNNPLAQEAGANDVGAESSDGESSGGEGGGGLFGWLFGGGENDNGDQTADSGWDDGGGWDNGE